MNDGKNMAGMVSEKVKSDQMPTAEEILAAKEDMQRYVAQTGTQRPSYACACGDGDGFCDRAARERAKMSAAIGARMRAADAAVGAPGAPIGLDAFLSASENARRPCCPCFTGSVLGCMCACHRLGTATGVGTLGGYVRHGSGQQSKAPGKQFTRSDILAILRGHLALSTHRPSEMNERDAIRALITIFENLE